MNKQNNNEQDNKIEKLKKDVKETEEAVKSSASLAKNAATGNVTGMAKDAVKLVANKKIRKRILINLVANILAPILVIVVLVVSILGIFNAVGEAINGIIAAIGDFFTVDPKDDGAINITDDEVEKLIQSIEDMGVSTQDLHLLGDYSANASEEQQDRELKKYIRKFYEAQVVTETPNYSHKKSGGGKTYGAVYIYRYDDSQNDKQRELTYVEYPLMQEFQKKGDEAALNHFSIDDSGNLVYAGEVKTVKETGTDKNKLSQDGPEEVSIQLRTMDYKSLISQYTTQMNFLVCLTMISQNPEFVSSVVDLIKDSRIEIVVMDNISIYQEIKTSEYIQHKKWTETVTVGAGDTKHDEERPRYSEKDVTEVEKITKTTVSPSPQITYVKTWFCEQGISYGTKQEGPTSTTSDPEKFEEPKPQGDGEWKTNGTKTTEIITESTAFQKMPSQKGLTYTLGERGDSTKYQLKQIPSPTFIGLMETKYRIPYSSREAEAGSNLVSGAEMLFFLLQKDPKLQNMELIMRYALYLYSGRDYGVTSLDASIFEIKDFKDVGVIEGSAIAEVIRSFENDSLRLYMDGTSSDYNAVEEYVTQDKKQYKMYYTKGDQCLNFSYGIMVRDKEGNLYYTDYFKDEGIDLKSLVAQYDAGQEVKVDVEIIDRIYLKDLNNIKNSLKEIFADKGVSIKEHQIDALVNVSYQYGNCGQTISGDENIVELYKKYYEKGKKEEFKNNAQLLASSGARVHFFLGSTYKDRKEKNWIMFDEGKYILSDGTEIKSGSSVVDFALQFEGENHSRFTNYNPSNGVDDVWAGNEWCAMFVSYCYNENGLIPDVLPKPYASCGYLKDLYEAGNTRVKIIGDRGYFQGKKKDSYIPSPGDIIFFNWGNANIASHTGIVVDCDGTKVYTIEGNTNSNSWTTSEVSQNEYLLDAACIVGYISING